MSRKPAAIIQSPRLLLPRFLRIVCLFLLFSMTLSSPSGQKQQRAGNCQQGHRPPEHSCLGKDRLSPFHREYSKRRQVIQDRLQRFRIVSASAVVSASTAAVIVVISASAAIIVIISTASAAAAGIGHYKCNSLAVYGDCIS